LSGCWRARRPPLASVCVALGAQRRDRLRLQRPAPAAVCGRLGTLCHCGPSAADVMDRRHSALGGVRPTDPLVAIQNDIERTFADMPMVAPRKPQIFRILRQYAADNPDIGYTQGMNYVAAAMVLKFPDSFALAQRRFAEAMLQFSGFWSEGFPLLDVAVVLFVRLAERHLSTLWDHLLSRGVEPLSYLPNGWLSLFGKWLPLPAVMECMDLVLECGIRGVLAVTLALFLTQQNRLLRAQGMEQLLELLNSDMRTSPIDGDLMVKCARLWLPMVDDELLASSAYTKINDAGSSKVRESQ